ncbi:conserved hypothetical protein [Theileria orientalis strain Shintoku]|uniref:Uncharacterized protein n=1 Tax=Theileria orientalis strain Shintoku TaxID=869250 RepID=J4C882_THEOR|nr:conserved hypothetical protein [Theileria orientalis strain Shintoku]BAM40333.1 conserved hypothetical protein [Theileria orientalis strain Shintoku]|eukprot:XP_009690634.1 conserved hypothetical protein [Theileria orientalis strain Shintoku]
MPVICLGTTHVLYIRGWIQVCVKEEPYSSCNLFKLCKHTLKPPRRGCIYVFKCSTGSNGSRKIKQGEYLSISNPCLCLECVDVYYNQHDPVKKPLVLVFKFKNGDDRSNGVTNRYYPMSCFETDKTQCPSKKIEDLCEYNEQSILCALLQENDSLPGLLTYDIMKRPTGAGDGNGANCKYNCGKIQVTKNGDDTSTSANGEPKLGAGFTRYKHAPTSTGGNSNGGNDNAGKPACIIYRCQTLMGGNGTQAQTQELPEIQGQTYKCVSVYFGCKAKRNGAGASTAGKSAGACPRTGDCKPGTSQCSTCPAGENSDVGTTCTPATGDGTCPPAPTEPTSPCNQDVPLLLELHRNGKNGASGDNNPQYYAHVRKNGAQETGDNSEGRYYWVQITGANSGNGAQNTLKDLLEDIGLSTTSSGGTGHNNGHETLKKLLKEALNGNGDGSDGANGDLTTQLQKMTGQNLTKLLGQPVNGSQPSVQNGRQNGQNTLITLLLNRIQFNVTDSVVVLLNRRPNNAGHNGGHNGSASGQNGDYGEREVSGAISGLEPNGRGTRINRLKLGNGAGGVNGKQITVTDVNTSNGDPSTVCKCLAKCLTKYGYCVIQHDFSQAVNTKLGQGCSAGLRLLIPARDNGRGNGGCQTKYAELRLYDDATKTDPAHLQYLYYRNGGQGAGSDGSAASATCATTADAQTCSKTQNAQICSRLYVVFYNGVGGTGGRTSGSAGTGDPRPLLLGYGGCWYRPKDKNGYFDTWVKVDLGDESAGTCTCSNGGSGGADVNCEKCKALFKALTTTVGFLNTVDLFQHPGTAGEGAQTPCQPCEPGAAGAGTECQAAPTSGQTTCQSETSSSGGNTCKYEVHQYMGKKVQVQVECQDVPNTQPSESTAQTCSQSATTQSCYRKLTHKPAGTGNGSGDASSSANNGFRLGDVVYCGNGCTGDTCKIDYYNNGGKDLAASDKWAPLLSVAVYYYNHDTGYCDPLLVELEFAKPGNGVQNGDNGDNEAKEYYKLIKINGDSGNRLVWEKDTDCAKDLVAKPECLTRYLDAIRYCLKKVVRIRLECKNGGQGYALEGRDASKGAKNGQGQFKPIENGVSQNGEVKVTVCECQCPALTARKYKCLKHGLTEALKPVHYQVAGLVFTLPGRNGDAGANGVVEIPLYSAEGVGPGGCPSSQSEGGCPAAPPGPTASCPPEPGPSNGFTIPPVHYNQCMGDVYVYFYATGGPKPSGNANGGSETDTVPLMLRYNGFFYKPESRDCYFDRWVCVPGLCKTAGECKGGCACCPGQDDAQGADCGPDCPCCKELANELDRVNECLNRIDLDPEKASKAGSGGSSGAGTGYGLPESNGGKDLDTSVGNNRVCLTEKKPTGDDAQKAYVKVVHRTKNGFRIGQLMYCGKEITQDGVTPTALKNGQCDGPGLGAGQTCNGAPASAEPGDNGTTKIEVAKGTGGRNGNGNHKNLVNENGWNTLVVYYSTSDKCYMLPQLIVLLNTDGPVKNGEAVTGTNSGKKYGYYILATKNGSTGGGGGLGGGPGYEYTWRLVNGSKSGETPVKLDDKTDFLLLNAAVILTEWTSDKNGGQGGKYNDKEIKKAVESAIKPKSELRSPGNDNDVNRLTGREITVKDETETGAGTGPCACVKQYGFKVMTHDLTPFVKLNGPFKDPLCNINLITGLKFLIPTGERGKYKQVQLNGDAAQNGSVRYHHPDNGDKVCVYFYGCDPRPLLVCYNGWAYRAKDMAAYNEQKWTQCTEVQGADAAKCGCAQTPPTGTCDKCPLIKALVGVADFLNPVNINVVSTCSRPCKYYGVHWFNGRRVRIRVLAQFACGSFCYHRFTHTHAGITGKGDGFRLGNIHYGGVNSKGEGSEQGGDSTCIKLNGAGGGGANGKCISASHDKNGGLKCGAFPVVVVFYYKLDTGHKSPIVVAMCTTDNGGPCPKLECNLYYVLKDRGKKTYTKGTGSLDMSDDKKLSDELDKALFNNSKKLQIVLSTRPVATEYKTGQNGLITDVFDTGTGDKSSNQKAAKQLFDVKTRILKEVAKEADEAEKTSKTTGTNALTAGKPLATRDALLHHVTLKTTYDAHLCDNKGQPSAPSEPNATEIPVEEVHCPGLQPGGYRCFKHALTTASGISEVGGLVLCLWVDKAGGKGASAQCQPCPKQGEGQGNEGLELCDGQTTSNGETGCKNGETGGKNGKNGQSVQLSYTTCKGNLYVFFYGEDPRPLMLCYDKHAYRPVCMADYCKQWVRVGNGPGGAGSTNCMCDDKTFDANKLLPELFRVSVLLNPVYLRLTVEAIAKLKPKRPDQQPGSAGTNGQQQPSSQSVSTDGQTGSAAADDYTYLTHNYPPDPVRVRVTTQDLQCYRRYTHKPEHEGFRLGRVTYAQPPCPEGAGAGQGTVVASSNGQCPAQPAPTPTPSTTTTTQAFCFKYAPEKQLQTVCTYYYMYDCAHYWPLVVELGFRGRPSEWWRLCSGPQEGGGNGNGGGGGGSGNGASGVPTTGNGGTDDPAPSKPPAQLKWVRMAASQAGTGAGAGQTGTGAGHTNTGTGTGTGDSCKDAPSTQPAATQPGANGENCAECPPPATGTGGPQPAHNGNNNHNGRQNNGQTDQTSQEQRENREQTCARDAAFARDAREIQDKLGKTVLGIPAYPRNYPGLEIDLRELIERRAYEIRKSLGIEYGSKGRDRLIMETDSNCQEESIMAYLVGGV